MKNGKMTTFDANVYSYPFKDGNTILYSPIARKMVLTDAESLSSYLKHGTHREIFDPLKEYIAVDRQRKVRVPDDYTLLTVLPNNTCNFKCEYCYSAAGRNNTVLDAGKLQTAIDYFIDSKPEAFSRPLSLSFMGGGEPLMSWQLLKSGILHALKRAGERNFRLNVSLITNGSLVDDEMMSFCLANKVNVSVSFDVLRDIQDKWRKNYDLVSRNLHRLCDSGLVVQINATITPANVNRMGMMLKQIHDEYVEVHAVMFEPVTGQQLFESPSDMRSFYKEYTEQFISCLRQADAWGISLTSFAYLRTVYPLDRACPGELCLTSEGYFSGCYCVGSSRDELFDKTRYGEVINGRVSFDMDRFQRLINDNVYHREECDDCEVKWNCGGGCFHQTHSYSSEYREEVCVFTKSFVAAITRYRVELHLTKHPDENIPTLINI